MQIVDNFLYESQLHYVQQAIMNVYNKDFPFYIQKSVANFTEDTPNWSWMGTHLLYHQHEPKSPFYDIINNAFLDKMDINALIRVKVNFYPWTETVRTHPFHVDCEFPNKAALFSINTCDGYTLFEDGTKIDSVANRMLYFDPQVRHCSSTTTNSHGRFNINFNFL